MISTKEQIAVIKNDFLEKVWNTNKIWKEHSTFNCSRIAVYDLVKRIEETAGSGQQRKGSGQPVSATTEQIANDCESLICS